LIEVKRRKARYVVGRLTVQRQILRLVTACQALEMSTEATLNIKIRYLTVLKNLAKYTIIPFETAVICVGGVGEK